MKALEAYNKVAKRIIGTSCSGGYFIDVGVDSIVCVTNTRVKCSSWEQYLKKHNADYLLNISFVNSTEEKPSTDLHEDSSPMFTVKEWVYPSIEITDEDINTIVSSIYSTHNGTYEDNTRLHIMPITVDATPREIYVLTWKHDGKEEVLGKEWANSNEAEAAAKSYIVSLYKKNGTIPTINLNRRAYSIIDKERHNPKDFFIKCLSQSNNEEISESNTHKNVKKNVVKLNENTLRQIVAESVKKVLKEGSDEWGFKEETIDAIREAYNALNGLHGLLRQEIYPVETEAAKDAKALDREIFTCMRSLGEYLFYI